MNKLQRLDEIRRQLSDLQASEETSVTGSSFISRLLASREYKKASKEWSRLDEEYGRIYRSR